MAVESLVKQLSHFAAPGMSSVPVSTHVGIEGASQSYKAGAPLIRSSGKLVTAGNAAVADIVGFAEKNATGVTDAAVPFIPAVPGISFEATLENQSTGDYVLARADMFVDYGLRVTSGGLWYLNKNDTSTVAAVIIDFVDPLGTIQGRVRARLLDTVTIYND